MHDLIEVTLNFLVHRSAPRAVSIRDYSEFNLERFLCSLQSLDWSSLYQTTTLDEKISIFNHYLVSTRDLHAPIRSFTARRSPATWLRASIRSLMRRRDAARRTYRSHPSPARRNAFCSLRNEVKLQIDNTKNKYLLNRLGAITNSARLWSELRSLGLANPKSSNSHPEIFLNQLNTFLSTAHLSSPSTPPVSAYPPSCFSSPPSSASPVATPHPSALLQIPDTSTFIPRHPVFLPLTPQ